MYRSHIPRSQFYDHNVGAHHTRLIPRGLQELDVFQSYVRSLGISKESHIVVYDRDEKHRITGAAPRAWWTFRVRDNYR